MRIYEGVNVTTLWQDTVTWKSGLVYEIPVEKLKAINGNNAIEIILCEKSDVNQPLSPANIKRRQTISTGEMGQISWRDSFSRWSVQYSCIVVDMRLRTHKVDCEFSTNDPVKGSATIHIAYHVTNSKKVVFDIEDVLANLTTLCQKTVVVIARKYSYKEIMEDSIFEDEIKRLDVVRFGLEIDDAHIPDQINFPSNLVDIISSPPMMKAEYDVKSVERTLLAKKLESIGLPDNIIAIVQASKDEDLKIIFDAANAYFLNKKQSKQNSQEFLEGLIAKGLVLRAPLEDALIPKLIDQVTSDGTEDANPIQFLLSAADSDSKKTESLPSANKDESITPSNDSTNDTYTVNKPTPNTESVENEDKKIFQFSVAHPLAVSKRFDSVFLCQIYVPESRSRALRNIKSEFQKESFDEQTKRSFVKFGQKVTVKLESSDFSFSEPATKIVNDSLIKFAIMGKPNDNSEPGYHSIKASVIDTITGEELDYLILKHVRVIDFAFDHISRPLLSRASTVILGIGSFAMFILTFLEQIDKTIGLTSGTAAGVLALGIYVSFYNLYQRVHPNTP